MSEGTFGAQRSFHDDQYRISTWSSRPVGRSRAMGSAGVDMMERVSAVAPLGGDGAPGEANGGANGSGGPWGDHNGNFRHGLYTREAKTIRRVLRAKVREIKALIQAANPRKQ